MRVYEAYSRFYKTGEIEAYMEPIEVEDFPLNTKNTYKDIYADSYDEYFDYFSNREAAEYYMWMAKAINRQRKLLN